LTPIGQENILLRKTRFLLRLLLLHKAKQVSADDWDEIMSLTTNRNSKMSKEVFSQVADGIATVMKAVTDTTLNENKIIDLFCMVSHTKLS
jgi:hypothetical protein